MAEDQKVNWSEDEGRRQWVISNVKDQVMSRVSWLLVNNKTRRLRS